MCKARLVAWNAGPELPLLAIKTSAGKAREKGVDYYLKEYSKAKPGELREWLVKAARGFPSVLEHVTLTFYIEGCSRVCTHQLVRHRIASYTMESQRYSLALDPSGIPGLEKAVKPYVEIAGYPEEKARLYAASALLQEASRRARDLASLVHGRRDPPPRWLRDAVRELEELAERFIVIPPSVREGRPGYPALLYFLSEVFASLAEYFSLVASGIPPEDARYILPQAVKTRLVMTVNLRELLHIARLRLSGKAQWEIRELAESMIQEAGRVIPFIRDLLDAYDSR